MNILIIHNSRIPVFKYGGIERVIWVLGNELVKKGHKVTYLVKKGAYCNFAPVIFINDKIPINSQIPKDIDIAHIHFQPKEKIQIPHLVTMHGNLPPETSFFINTSYVSQNHAERYGADAFVYNGLDWDDYGFPDFNRKRNYVHFLGKAAWKIKNVKGAIKIAKENKTELKVLGGTRLNFKMGMRFTVTKWAKFYGMVGGTKKNELLKNSGALIFPVLWHEPFGLAIIESLYFGCPVFGTKFGSLPELINDETGFLSNSIQELIGGLKNHNLFDRKKCHEYAVSEFNSRLMAESYLKLYERILNGEKINRNIPQYIPGKNSLEKYLA